MVYFTFVSDYSAVHTLWNARLRDEENLDAYGVCANPAGHGHLYRLEVTVAADVSSDRPFVMDKRAIRHIIDDILAPRMRHENLNRTFGEIAVSSGENVTRAVWDLIEPELPEGVHLFRVNLTETPKNSFACEGGVSSRL
jgi:6-pyruvoyltetrahydropterin/6-carboxytetrahydropterin synthase